MGQAFLHGNGGVANGCTLTVNAPAGVTVTITKGSKTKTKTADSSGYATFKGLEQGEWTVTISSGSQTAKKTVYIVTEYDAAITFFSAAINVSYPAGSILTCTDGSTTLTAGNTTGSWYFTIPNAGNWTVTATSGSNSASQTVSITADGQVEQVVLSYTTYLYVDGDECESISGGWSVGNIVPSGYSSYGNATLTKNATNMLFSGETNNIWAGKETDLSGVGALRLVGTQPTARYVEFWVADKKANGYARKVYGNNGKSNFTTNIDITIDVSDIESGWVGIGIYEGHTDLTITEIEMI